MCSLDGRSRINTGVIPMVGGKRAWKDHIESWEAFDARSKGQPGYSLWGNGKPDEKEWVSSLDARSGRPNRPPSLRRQRANLEGAIWSTGI